MEKRSFKYWFIQSLNGMALGLFASLLIGLIMKQAGTLLNIDILIQFGEIAQSLMGPAIGVGVAYSLNAPPLVVLSSVIVGAIGAGSIELGEYSVIAIGEPVGAYIAAIAGVLATKYLDQENSFKILTLPLATILIGGIVGVYLSPVISSVMNLLGEFINRATELNPIPMGIIVSVFMGIFLTLPISSAAIAISLGLSGLAAGAAVVGCCCNMIGFAVISYKDNGPGGVVALGLGTSMLQISNIVKNPKIWIPSIVSSAILGPISTKVLQMTNNKLGAGMGTSGLVGQLAAFDAMGYSASAFFQVAFMHFILPAIISYGVYVYLYKKNHIVDGDLKI